MSNSIRFAGLVSLLFATGCGGDDIECGEGTRQVGETCVAETGGMDNTNDNANTNDNTNPTTCGDGTVLEGNACVPVASLSSFTVTAAAVNCDTIVSGVSTVAVTVTAVDSDGATLSDFSGMVSLVGLGGITVSPSTAMLAAGTGVANVAVNGLTNVARIAVFDTTGTVAGRTDEFSVVAEEIRLTGLTGPVTAVRSGEAFDLTLSLETNACRPPAMDAAGSILINADNGVRVVPSQVLLDGTASITQSFTADGSQLGATTPVTISGQLAVGAAQTATVTVIPPIRFNGIASAVATDADNAVIAFAPASGGEPPYTYTVFSSTTAGVLGDALSPTIAGGATTGTYAVGGVAGDSVFFTVRVADSLASDIDSNLVQASVVKGPVVFVDSTNTGTADGGAGTPYTTLSAAVADGRLSSGGTIYVSAGTYAELPLDLSANAGLQFAGGFTGFSGPSTTAADWMLSQNNTALDYDGSTTPTGTLLSLGANASLSNFDVALTYTGTDVIVAGTTRLEARNSRIGGTDVASTGSRVLIPAGDVTLTGTTLQGPTVAGAIGMSVQDGTATLSGSTLSGFATGLQISTNVDPSVAAILRDSLIENSAIGVNITNGAVTVTGTRFEGITDRGLLGTDSEVDVDETDFVDGVSGITVSGQGGLVVTRSRFVDLDRGIDGAVGSVAGERRPLRLINNLFEVDRYGVSITSGSQTGVFDTLVRDNVFLSLLSGQETALSIQLRNEEQDLEGTLIVENNAFFEFQSGFDFEISEGNSSTATASPLVASFTGNYGRHSPQANYGDAFDGRFYSSGSISLTAQGNVFRSARDGISVYAVAETSNTVDVIDNSVESALVGGYPRIRIQARSDANNVASGIATARFNSVVSPGIGYSSGSMRVRGDGNVDVVVTDNEIAGPGEMEGFGFGNVNVSNNRIAGGFLADFDAELGRSGCCSDNSGGDLLEGARTLTVEGNTALAATRSSLLASAAIPAPNSDLTQVVRGNTVFAESIGVYGASFNVNVNTNDNSAADLDVIGNEVEVASFRVTARGPANDAPNVDVNVTNNLVDASRDIGLRLVPQNGAIDANFSENLFRLGVSSSGFDIEHDFRLNNTSTAGNGNVNLAFRKNVVEFGGESQFDVDERGSGPATQSDVDISNNILRVNNGSSSPVAIRNMNANSSVDFVHNTLSGSFDGFNVAAVNVNSSPATVRVIDNVFDNARSSTSDPILTSNPSTTTIDNNVVWRATTNGTNDRIGVPVFVNPVDRVVILIVTDPLRNEVEVLGGSVSAGDRVVVGGSMVARTVLAVVPPLATLDGEPIAATSGAIVDALAWDAGNFVGPVPDYGLVDGTVGQGIATDTGDIGAGGGPDPFTSQPMLPAP